MKLTAVTAAVLLAVASATAQTPDGALFAPTESQKATVAKDVAKKLTKDPIQQASFIESIEKAIKIYMADPAVATDYNSETMRQLSDSISTLKSALNTVNVDLKSTDKRLADLCRAAAEAESRDEEALTARRESLDEEVMKRQSELNEILRADSLLRVEIDSLRTELSVVDAKASSLQLEKEALAEEHSRNTAVKDELDSRKAEAAAVVDRIRANYEKMQAMPLSAQDVKLIDASKKELADNMSLLSNYRPELIDTANDIIGAENHLLEGSALLGEAEKAMAGKFDDARNREIADRLTAYNRATDLTIPQSQEIKTTVSELGQQGENVRTMTQALRNLTANDNYITGEADQRAEFKAAIEGVKINSPRYKAIIAVRDNFVDTILVKKNNFDYDIKGFKDYIESLINKL